MLVRKVAVPIGGASKDTERAEEELFFRLDALARDRSFLLDCTVQLFDHEFMAVLSDHFSNEEVCAWSGSADAIVAEFEAWLARRSPPTAHPAPAAG